MIWTLAIAVIAFAAGVVTGAWALARLLAYDAAEEPAPWDAR